MRNALKQARVPWFAKAVTTAAVGYLLSPVQLIPDWVPVLGFVDNCLVFAIAFALLRACTPPDILAECRECAHHSVTVQVRLPAWW